MQCNFFLYCPTFRVQKCTPVYMRERALMAPILLSCRALCTKDLAHVPCMVAASDESLTHTLCITGQALWPIGHCASWHCVVGDRVLLETLCCWIPSVLGYLLFLEAMCSWRSCVLGALVVFESALTCELFMMLILEELRRWVMVQFWCEVGEYRFLKVDGWVFGTCVGPQWAILFNGNRKSQSIWPVATFQAALLSYALSHFLCVNA